MGMSNAALLGSTPFDLSQSYSHRKFVEEEDLQGLLSTAPDYAVLSPSCREKAMPVTECSSAKPNRLIGVATNGKMSVLRSQHHLLIYHTKLSGSASLLDNISGPLWKDNLSSPSDLSAVWSYGKRMDARFLFPQISHLIAGYRLETVEVGERSDLLAVSGKMLFYESEETHAFLALLEYNQGDCLVNPGNATETVLSAAELSVTNFTSGHNFSAHPLLSDSKDRICVGAADSDTRSYVRLEGLALFPSRVDLPISVAIGSPTHAFVGVPSLDSVFSLCCSSKRIWSICFSFIDDCSVLSTRNHSLLQGSKFGYTLLYRQGFLHVGAPTARNEQEVVGGVYQFQIGNATEDIRPDLCGYPNGFIHLRNVWYGNVQGGLFGTSFVAETENGRDWSVCVASPGEPSIHCFPVFSSSASSDKLPMHRNRLGSQFLPHSADLGISLQLMNEVLLVGSPSMSTDPFSVQEIPGRIYFKTVCLPGRRRYTFAKNDSIPAVGCEWCEAGTFSVGIFEEECTSCEVITSKPDRAAWIPRSPCDYVCDDGYFGKHCEACSTYASRKGMTAPSNAEWVDGFSECRWECKEGYSLATNGSACVPPPAPPQPPVLILEKRSSSFVELWMGVARELDPERDTVYVRIRVSSHNTERTISFDSSSLSEASSTKRTELIEDNEDIPGIEDTSSFYSVHIGHLVADTSYILEIAVGNIGGKSPWGPFIEEFSVQTRSKTRSRQHASPQIEAGSSFIVVEIEPPAETGGSINIDILVCVSSGDVEFKEDENDGGKLPPSDPGSNAGAQLDRESCDIIQHVDTVDEHNMHFQPVFNSSTVVKDLSRDTGYKLSVIIINELGESPPSEVVQVFTKARRFPGAPTNVRCKPSTNEGGSVNITWLSPVETGGADRDQLRYIVFTKEPKQPDPEEACTSPRPSNYVSSITCVGNTLVPSGIQVLADKSLGSAAEEVVSPVLKNTEFTLNYLAAGATHKLFLITFYTESGTTWQSSLSETVECEASHGIGQGERLQINVSQEACPGHITLEQTFPFNLHGWAPKDLLTQVEVWDETAGVVIIPMQCVESKVPWASLSLKGKFHRGRYAIRTKSVSVDGQEIFTPSEWHTVDIEGNEVPEPPRNVNTVAIGADILTLTWESPSFHGSAEVRSYDVFISTTGADFTKYSTVLVGKDNFTNCSSTNIYFYSKQADQECVLPVVPVGHTVRLSVTELQPMTSYFFRIASRNRYGSSCLSKSTGAFHTVHRTQPDSVTTSRYFKRNGSLYIAFDEPYSTGGEEITGFALRVSHPGENGSSYTTLQCQIPAMSLYVPSNFTSQSYHQVDALPPCSVIREVALVSGDMRTETSNVKGYGLVNVTASSLCYASAWMDGFAVEYLSSSRPSDCPDLDSGQNSSWIPLIRSSNGLKLPGVIRLKGSAATTEHLSTIEIALMNSQGTGPFSLAHGYVDMNLPLKMSLCETEFDVIEDVHDSSSKDCTVSLSLLKQPLIRAPAPELIWSVNFQCVKPSSFYVLYSGNESDIELMKDNILVGTKGLPCNAEACGVQVDAAEDGRDLTHFPPDIAAEITNVVKSKNFRTVAPPVQKPCGKVAWPIACKTYFRAIMDRIQGGRTYFVQILGFRDTNLVAFSTVKRQYIEFGMPAFPLESIGTTTKTLTTASVRFGMPLRTMDEHDCTIHAALWESFFYGSYSGKAHASLSTPLALMHKSELSCADTYDDYGVDEKLSLHNLSVTGLKPGHSYTLYLSVSTENSYSGNDIKTAFLMDDVTPTTIRHLSKRLTDILPDPVGLSYAEPELQILVKIRKELMHPREEVVMGKLSSGESTLHDLVALRDMHFLRYWRITVNCTGEGERRDSLMWFIPIVSGSHFVDTNDTFIMHLPDMGLCDASLSLDLMDSTTIYVSDSVYLANSTSASLSRESVVHFTKDNQTLIAMQDYPWGAIGQRPFAITTVCCNCSCTFDCSSTCFELSRVFSCFDDNFGFVAHIPNIWYERASSPGSRYDMTPRLSWWLFPFVSRVPAMEVEECHTLDLLSSYHADIESKSVLNSEFDGGKFESTGKICGRSAFLTDTLSDLDFPQVSVLSVFYHTPSKKLSSSLLAIGFESARFLHEVENSSLHIQVYEFTYKNKSKESAFKAFDEAKEKGYTTSTPVYEEQLSSGEAIAHNFSTVFSIPTERDRCYAVSIGKLSNSNTAYPAARPVVVCTPSMIDFDPFIQPHWTTHGQTFEVYLPTVQNVLDLALENNCAKLFDNPGGITFHSVATHGCVAHFLTLNQSSASHISFLERLQNRNTVDSNLVSRSRPGLHVLVKSLNGSEQQSLRFPLRSPAHHAVVGCPTSGLLGVCHNFRLDNPQYIEDQRIPILNMSEPRKINVAIRPLYTDMNEKMADLKFWTLEGYQSIPNVTVPVEECYTATGLTIKKDFVGVIYSSGCPYEVALDTVHFNSGDVSTSYAIENVVVPSCQNGSRCMYFVQHSLTHVNLISLRDLQQGTTTLRVSGSYLFGNFSVTVGTLPRLFPPIPSMPNISAELLTSNNEFIKVAINTSEYVMFDSNNLSTLCINIFGSELTEDEQVLSLLEQRCFLMNNDIGFSILWKRFSSFVILGSVRFPSGLVSDTKLLGTFARQFRVPASLIITAGSGKQGYRDVRIMSDAKSFSVDQKIRLSLQPATTDGKSKSEGSTTGCNVENIVGLDKNIGSLRLSDVNESTTVSHLRGQTVMDSGTDISVIMRLYSPPVGYHWFVENLFYDTRRRKWELSEGQNVTSKAGKVSSVFHSATKVFEADEVLVNWRSPKFFGSMINVGHLVELLTNSSDSGIYHFVPIKDAIVEQDSKGWFNRDYAFEPHLQSQNFSYQFRSLFAESLVRYQVSPVFIQQESDETLTGKTLAELLQSHSGEKIKCAMSFRSFSTSTTQSVPSGYPDVKFNLSHESNGIWLEIGTPQKTGGLPVACYEIDIGIDGSLVDSCERSNHVFGYDSRKGAVLLAATTIPQEGFQYGQSIVGFDSGFSELGSNVTEIVSLNFANQSSWNCQPEKRVGAKMLEERGAPSCVDPREEQSFIGQTTYEFTTVGCFRVGTHSTVSMDYLPNRGFCAPRDACWREAMQETSSLPYKPNVSASSRLPKGAPTVVNLNLTAHHAFRFRVRAVTAMERRTEADMHMVMRSENSSNCSPISDCNLDPFQAWRGSNSPVFAVWTPAHETCGPQLTTLKSSDSTQLKVWLKLSNSTLCSPKVVSAFVRRCSCASRNLREEYHCGGKSCPQGSIWGEQTKIFEAQIGKDRFIGSCKDSNGFRFTCVRSGSIWETLPILIGNLSAATPYLVESRLETFAGMIVNSSAITTLGTNPSAPLNLTVVPNLSSPVALGLSWMPPRTDGGLRIEQYRVNVMRRLLPSNSLFNAGNMKLVQSKDVYCVDDLICENVSGLVPATIYYVTVHAIGTVGNWSVPGYTSSPLVTQTMDPLPCPNNCSGLGDCHPWNGKCTCFTGYRGKDCSSFDGSQFYLSLRTPSFPSDFSLAWKHSLAAAMDIKISRLLFLSFERESEDSVSKLSLLFRRTGQDETPAEELGENFEKLVTAHPEIVQGLGIESVKGDLSGFETTIPPSNCSEYKNCSSCLSSLACGWCSMSASCVTGYRQGAASYDDVCGKIYFPKDVEGDTDADLSVYFHKKAFDTDRQECQPECFEVGQNEEDFGCSSCANRPDCKYCISTRRCEHLLDTDEYTNLEYHKVCPPIDGEVTPDGWVDDVGRCPPQRCTSSDMFFSTRCLNDRACGWCSRSNGISFCAPGDSFGMYSGHQCSDRYLYGSRFWPSCDVSLSIPSPCQSCSRINSASIDRRCGWCESKQSCGATEGVDGSPLTGMCHSSEKISSELVRYPNVWTVTGLSQLFPQELLFDSTDTRGWIPPAREDECPIRELTPEETCEAKDNCFSCLRTDLSSFKNHSYLDLDDNLRCGWCEEDEDNGGGVEGECKLVNAENRQKCSAKLGLNDKYCTEKRCSKRNEHKDLEGTVRFGSAGRSCVGGSSLIASQLSNSSHPVWDYLRFGRNSNERSVRVLGTHDRLFVKSEESFQQPGKGCNKTEVPSIYPPGTRCEWIIEVDTDDESVDESNDHKLVVRLHHLDLGPGDMLLVLDDEGRDLSMFRRFTLPDQKVHASFIGAWLATSISSPIDEIPLSNSEGTPSSNAMERGKKLDKLTIYYGSAKEFKDGTAFESTSQHRSIESSSKRLRIVFLGDSGGGSGLHFSFSRATSERLDVYFLAAIVVAAFCACLCLGCCVHKVFVRGANQRHDDSDEEVFDDDEATLSQLQDRASRRGESARESIIKKFPAFYFDKSLLSQTPLKDKPDDELACSITLQEYEDGDIVKILPCGHHFELSAITEWLKLRKTCPLCKADVNELWESLKKSIRTGNCSISFGADVKMHTSVKGIQARHPERPIAVDEDQPTAYTNPLFTGSKGRHKHANPDEQKEQEAKGNGAGGSTTSSNSTETERNSSSSRNERGWWTCLTGYFDRRTTNPHRSRRSFHGNEMMIENPMRHDG